MSAIPQGVFLARKVRASLQRVPPTRGDSTTGRHRGTWRLELSPLKYNSKLMNSIWGLYNRYSVHNFKKNTDANVGLLTGLVHVVEQHRYLAFA